MIYNNRIKERIKCGFIEALKILALAIVFQILIFYPLTKSYTLSHYKKVGIVTYKDNNKIIIQDLLNGEEIWWKSSNRIEAGDVVLVTYFDNYTTDITEDDELKRVRVIIKHTDDMEQQEIKEENKEKNILEERLFNADAGAF